MASVRKEIASRVTILSDSDSDVIPVRAFPDSSYTGEAEDKPIINVNALFHPRHGIVVFNGKYVLSDLKQSHIRYVGSRYPGDTSIPFIPVGAVTIKPVGKRIGETCCHNSIDKLPGFPGSWKPKAHREVLLCVSEETWTELKKQLETFLVQNSEQLTLKTQGSVRCSRSTFEVHIRCALPHKEVARVYLEGKWWEKNIFDALASRRKLRGNAFIMPKYRRMPGDLEGDLSFELYGIWVTQEVEQVFDTSFPEKVKF